MIILNSSYISFFLVKQMLTAKSISWQKDVRATDPFTKQHICNHHPAHLHIYNSIFGGSVVVYRNQKINIFCDRFNSIKLKLRNFKSEIKFKYYNLDQNAFKYWILTTSLLAKVHRDYFFGLLYEKRFQMLRGHHKTSDLFLACEE